jgi:hypothetical protein
MFRSFNHHHLFQNGSASGEAGDAQPKKQWVLGIFLMTLSNVLAGLWTVLQVHTFHFIYPVFRFDRHCSVDCRPQCFWSSTAETY